MKKTLFSTALLLGSVSFSWALDTEAFTASVQQAAKAYELTLNKEKIDINGNTIIMHGVTVTNTGKTDASTASLGDVVFNNVREGKDGSYTVDTVQIDKASGAENKNGTFSLEGLLVKNAYLAPLNTPFKYSGNIPYTQATLKSMNLTEKGRNVLTMQNAAISYPGYRPGSPIRYEVKIETFAFDSEVLSPEAAKHFNELGYKKIEGTFNTAGSWNPVTGDFDQSTFTLSAKNIGAWYISLQLQGLTEKLYEELQARAADTKAPINLLNQIKLQSFQIRYEDASLINRLFDRESKRKSQSRSDTIAQQKTIISELSANTFKQSAFGKKLVTAIGVFFDNPQSLQFSIKPAEPVSIVTLGMGTIMAPEEAIDSMNADITANQ